MERSELSLQSLHIYTPNTIVDTNPLSELFDFEVIKCTFVGLRGTRLPGGIGVLNLTAE
jgi:hypothetical protein